jgi:hypothetical protein
LQLFVIVAMVVVMAWVIEGRMHLLLGLAGMAAVRMVAHQHRALVFDLPPGCRETGIEELVEVMVPSGSTKQNSTPLQIEAREVRNVNRG